MATGKERVMAAENTVLLDLWREDLQELGSEEMEAVLTQQDTVMSRPSLSRLASG